MSLVVPLAVDPPAVPARFPSPFARAPHLLARRAAEQMMATLPALAEGKMFGVLVVERAGRVGYLRAFSGMLDGRWTAEGFVPPVFDPRAREAWWPAREAELDELTARLAANEATAVRDELAALDRLHAAELDALRARHRANRDARRAARDRGGGSHALDQESRGDAAEKRRMLARHRDARASLALAVAALDEQRDTLVRTRGERSRCYLHALFDAYAIANARGETRSLRALFAPDEPPGGAGDCAAPKLFAHAYREGLRPIALAEVWWGPPPPTGGRHHGVFYPACRGKCGPILAHALGGLDAEPAPVFGAAAIAADEPRIVLETGRYVIVDKPVGLLSVPGRSPALADCVQARLAGIYGEAHVVHRLDLDASGLMLVARDREMHAALQGLFACRAIDKRYVAWLAGTPDRDRGSVELALRVDLDDRPRQIHDPIRGRPALTEWRVIERLGGRTKVELWPRTGRAHQLRVHAAHPLGIGAPIVGDPLYGCAAERLMLHAERLSFVDPHTDRRVDVTCRVPF